MKKNKKAALYVALTILSYGGFIAIVMNNKNYVGTESYLEDFKKVSRFTVFLALLVQAFWFIIIDVLMGYLSKTMGWLPPARVTLKPKEVMTPKRLSKPSFDEDEEDPDHRQKVDEDEFNLILQSPVLSPFAFLWKGVRGGYRSVKSLPQKISKNFAWLFYYFRVGFKNLHSFKKEIIDSIIYIGYPTNLVDILLNIAISIMTKVLIPMSLLPLLLLAVPALNWELNNIVFFAIYFVVTGIVRLGIWNMFFQIRIIKSEN